MAFQPQQESFASRWSGNRYLTLDQPVRIRELMLVVLFGAIWSFFFETRYALQSLALSSLLGRDGATMCFANCSLTFSAPRSTLRPHNLALVRLAMMLAALVNPVGKTGKRINKRMCVAPEHYLQFHCSPVEIPRAWESIWLFLATLYTEGYLSRRKKYTVMTAPTAITNPRTQASGSLWAIQAPLYPPTIVAIPTMNPAVQ